MNEYIIVYGIIGMIVVGLFIGTFTLFIVKDFIRYIKEKLDNLSIEIVETKNHGQRAVDRTGRILTVQDKHTEALTHISAGQTICEAQLEANEKKMERNLDALREQTKKLEEMHRDIK